MKNLLLLALLSLTLYAKETLFDYNFNGIDQQLNLSSELTFFNQSLDYHVDILESYENNDSTQNYLYDLGVDYALPYYGIDFLLGGGVIYSQMNYNSSTLNHDIFAIALHSGARFSHDFTLHNPYYLPFTFYLKTLSELNFSYTPSFLGFTNKFDAYKSLLLKVNFTLFNNVWGYIGYRNIGMEYSNLKKTLYFEKGFIVGFKLQL
jgi:hypothetical protein